MPLGKLTCGCVLHIAGFSSRGHTPRNKYILILGQVNDYTALGFLISSQLAYLGQDSHRVEVVRIPQGATGFLRYESIIQCFELEQLSIPDLSDGFDNRPCGRGGAHTNTVPSSNQGGRYQLQAADATRHRRGPVIVARGNGLTNPLSVAYWVRLPGQCTLYQTRENELWKPARTLPESASGAASPRPDSPN